MLYDDFAVCVSHPIVYLSLRYTSIVFKKIVTVWLHVHVRLLHCMRVQLHNGYTGAYVQILQHNHTHKAVTRHIEVKKITLSPKIFRSIEYHLFACITYI